MPYLSRRHFLGGALATAAWATQADAADRATAMPPLCIFSKHLQFITDWDALADTYVELGLDGVDLTVRRGGHIEPDNAAKELPKAVAACKARGLQVPMITTLLERGDDPAARPTLEAAAASGIRYFRCGTGRYKNEAPVMDELKAYREGLASLAYLAEELDVVGGYHNHSGPNYIGAPLWDLHKMLVEIGSDHLGSNFDIGHATAEGAMGAGLTNARLLAPYVHMCAVKDFRWGENGRAAWCPLGDGVVPMADYFKIIRQTGFSGPVSIHFEYKVSDNETLLQHMKNAVGVTRRAMAEAGYTG